MIRRTIKAGVLSNIETLLKSHPDSALQPMVCLLLICSICCLVSLAQGEWVVLGAHSFLSVPMAPKGEC